MSFAAGIARRITTAASLGIRWCWGHGRLTVEAMMVIALLIGGWMYNGKVRQIEEGRKSAEGLADDLRRQLKVVGSQIEILKRDASGKVIYERVYVPPEGYVIVRQKDLAAARAELEKLKGSLQTSTGHEREALLRKIKDLEDKMSKDDVEIVVKNRGLTFKPGFGMDYAGIGLKPRVDFKFYFYDRYGAIFGGSENGVGLGLSRHLDDILWGRPQNIEAFIQYNFILNPRNSPIAGGIRLNF